MMICPKSPDLRCFSARRPDAYNQSVTLAYQLRALEEELLRPEIRKDPIHVADLLADDFREFGKSGRVFDKSTVLTSLQEESTAQILMQDFTCTPVADHAALITYRSIRIEPTGQRLEALRSSLWVFREDRWQVLFHQGTPTTNGPQ